METNNKKSTLQEKSKALGIRLLAGTLRSMHRLTRRSPRWLSQLITPIKAIGEFFLMVGILPVYRGWLGSRKIIKKFYAPHKSRNRIIHPFARRFWVHFVVILLGIFTLANNLNANEVRREDFGRTSIISALITTDDLGSLQEEGPIVAPVRTRYLDQTNVEPQLAVIEGDATGELLPSTVAGGSAVVRTILSPVEEGLRQRDKIVQYTVQPGDTVSEIAEQFGITSNTLLWENNLTAYSLIRPGDTLTILPTSGIRHKVTSGDTLEKIASQYKVEVDDIIDGNKLASADDLRVGEQLLIPGGQKPYVRPTYTLRSTWYQPPPEKTDQVVASGQMVWPTNCQRITQYYGWLHSGLDIACPLGSPVFAADSGTVIRAQGGYNGGYGNVVVIDHGNGTQTLYAHNSKLYVEVGEEVTKGETIAAMGSTGRSTGSHTHFEVRVGGSRTNPLTYIR